MKPDEQPIRKELLDELLAEYPSPDDLTGPDGLLKRLTGALVERALQAEMTDHPGYEPGAAEGQGSGNSRNGAGEKTLRTDQGEVTVEVPLAPLGRSQLALLGRSRLDPLGRSHADLIGRSVTPTEPAAAPSLTVPMEKLLKGPLTLGGALSAIREGDGQSLAQFAQRLGISRSHLSDIEHGRRAVGLERAADFARVLGHHQAQFVRLALQDQVRNADLKFRVDVHAA